MDVKVVASGPATVPFVNAGDSKYKATITSAGSYVLAATFGGKLASGTNLCLSRNRPFGHGILPDSHDFLPVGNQFRLLTDRLPLGKPLLVWR